MIDDGMRIGQHSGMSFLCSIPPTRRFALNSFRDGDIDFSLIHPKARPQTPSPLEGEGWGGGVEPQAQKYVKNKGAL